MKLNIDTNWLLQRIEHEKNSLLSVGGLVTRIETELDKENSRPLSWSQLFPLNAMRKYRFTLPNEVSDTEALLSFFDIPSVDVWEKKWGSYAVAFRQTREFDARKEAVAAWVRECEIIATQIPLLDFSEVRLRSSLNELRLLTREKTEVALDKAQEICSRAGVAVVLVPELPLTRISGCARWFTANHAIIGLTIRYKHDDQLWFTFFHELGHILLHRERHSSIVDNAAEEMGDEVVDPEMMQFEKEADQFASDTLIPPDVFAKFIQGHGENLTNDAIHSFAEEIGIGPGIVIGRLQHEGFLHYWQGNVLKQKLNWDFVVGGV